jgi:hypothetical protein
VEGEACDYNRKRHPLKGHRRPEGGRERRPVSSNRCDTDKAELGRKHGR